MIKINEIPNNNEPRTKMDKKIKDHLENKDKLVVWMAPSESAFLCGALQSYRPKKILEVGIAHGGTTAIVLQLLEELGEPYEMHSVDLAPKTGGKDTGWIATLAKENNFYTPPPVNLAR